MEVVVGEELEDPRQAITIVLGFPSQIEGKTLWLRRHIL